MILAALVAVAIARGQDQPFDYKQVSHAISAGRLDQARAMILSAVENGVSGDGLERVMAQLDDASGHCERAVPRYMLLLGKYPKDGPLAEASALSALKCGSSKQAEYSLSIALSRPQPSWRAWNAQGVASDGRRDWAAADEAYGRAIQLAPSNAQVANNHGWSLLLRGRWSEAVAELERAVELDGAAKRAVDNLELARTALDASLPARRSGEGEADWAARLNDAGVLAQFGGDRKKAVAAFSQALEVRSQWFERAANNLQLSEGGK